MNRIIFIAILWLISIGCMFMSHLANGQDVTYGPYTVLSQPRLNIPSWRARYEAINSDMLASGNQDVIFFGDSITQGWESAPAWSRFKNAINAGIVSDRPEHLLWRVQNGAMVYSKVVVVMIGVNSVGSDPDATVAAIGAVLAAVRARAPKAIVVPMALLPVRGHKEWVDAVNARLRKHYPDLLDIGDRITPDMQPDGLHMNWKGYEVWADALLPLVPK